METGGLRCREKQITDLTTGKKQDKKKKRFWIYHIYVDGVGSYDSKNNPDSFWEMEN